MFRIAIVEDEKEYQTRHVEYLSRYEKEHKRSTLTAMAEELADYYFVKTGRQSVKTVSS